MKPWQAPLNKASSKGGKEETKTLKTGPKSEPQEQNSNRVTMGAKEQIMFQSPHQLHKVYQKGKRNLKEQ
jgi:hypothetical protein